MILLAVCLGTRVLGSWLNYVLPEMEPDYIRTALAVLDHSENASRLPPAYGIILYGFRFVARNWLLSSHALYVVCSTAGAMLTYFIARSVVEESVAIKALILGILLPIFTVALVGYSHTVAVGYCFLLLTLLAFQRLCDRSDPRWWWLIAAFSGGAAVLIRTEYVLAMPILVCAWLWRWRAVDGRGRRIVLAGTMTLIVFGMLFGTSRAQASADPGEPIGLFGNARYSYRTFLHTLSIRANGQIDDTLALQLGASAFGSEEANHYSIARAIARNPKEILANVAFNSVALVKEAAHPLFMPIFLLPLAVVGFRRMQLKWETWAILLSVVPGTVFFLLLFHVEIRYMTPLTLPLIIMTAAGLDFLEKKWTWLPPVIYSILAVLLVAYSLHVRRAGAGPGDLKGLVVSLNASPSVPRQLCPCAPL